MEKKLCRSRTDKKVAGVCGGLKKYFNMNIDTTVVRLIWALVCLCGGAGILAYLICALVIPEEPEQIEG